MKFQTGNQKQDLKIVRIKSFTTLQDSMTQLFEIYERLLNHFGSQGWWPTSDHYKPVGWEVCVGAILTQNTNWKNVEKALENLKESKSLSPEKLSLIRISKLEKLIRPSGFYRQKARRLKNFSHFALTFGSATSFLEQVTREQLLSFNGVGKETADSILLYACGKPFFVIDAYTRRIFSRIGMINGDEKYEKLRNFFESALPRNIKLYKEYHALIVELAKGTCEKDPACHICPLAKICKFGQLEKRKFKQQP